MDLLVRAVFLRKNIAEAMERLYNMEGLQERADDFITAISAQISYLTLTMTQIKKPGVAVSMREYTVLVEELSRAKQRKTKLEIELFSLTTEMHKVEQTLESNTKELSLIESRLGKFIPFRRKDDV
jgi:predicted  nucleic acid-binding Zn-ribbon protein